jgi:hypothetical protein
MIWTRWRAKRPVYAERARGNANENAVDSRRRSEPLPAVHHVLPGETLRILATDALAEQYIAISKARRAGGPVLPIACTGEELPTTLRIISSTYHTRRTRSITRANLCHSGVNTRLFRSELILRSFMPCSHLVAAWPRLLRRRFLSAVARSRNATFPAQSGSFLPRCHADT